LHRVFGGLKNASGHGWQDPLRNAIMMYEKETSKLG
jgi:hypothetical protein